MKQIIIELGDDWITGWKDGVSQLQPMAVRLVNPQGLRLEQLITVLTTMTITSCETLLDSIPEDKRQGEAWEHYAEIFYVLKSIEGRKLRQHGIDPGDGNGKFTVC